MRSHTRGPSESLTLAPWSKVSSLPHPPPPSTRCPCSFLTWSPMLALEWQRWVQEFWKKKRGGTHIYGANRTLAPVGTGMSEGDVPSQKWRKKKQSHFARFLCKKKNVFFPLAWGTHTKSDAISAENGEGSIACVNFTSTPPLSLYWLTFYHFFFVPLLSFFLFLFFSVSLFCRFPSFQATC